MKLLLTISSIFLAASLFGQSADNAFASAYYSFPSVTEGVLEAVAWTNTHMVHLEGQEASCSGLPRAYGIMGLHDKGKNYFIENGKIVERFSGITIDEQKASASQQIYAYAHAYNTLMGIELANGGAIEMYFTN